VRPAWKCLCHGRGLHLGLSLSPGRGDFHHDLDHHRDLDQHHDTDRDSATLLERRTVQ
jgi:hypothetical protein